MHAVLVVYIENDRNSLTSTHINKKENVYLIRLVETCYFYWKSKTLCDKLFVIRDGLQCLENRKTIILL